MNRKILASLAAVAAFALSVGIPTSFTNYIPTIEVVTPAPASACGDRNDGCTTGVFRNDCCHPLTCKNVDKDGNGTCG